MASLSKDANGTFRLHVIVNGRRKPIRLGKLTKKAADAVRLRVENLAAAVSSGLAIDPETAAWISTIGDDLAAKLAKARLMPGRMKAVTTGDFLKQWLAAKEAAGYEASSLIAYGQSAGELSALYPTRPLPSLTHTDGEGMREAMKARGLKSSTVHKRLSQVRGMLEDAVRLGHITTNPFKHVRSRPGDPSERRAYIPVADTLRVIDHCPNVWWKLMVALARFDGLRTPSETFSLNWGCVDWEQERLTVISPKGAVAGKGHRIIPLFTLIRPHMEAAFDHAEEGSEFVFPDRYRKRARGKRRWAGANFRTTLQKVIVKAGVNPWPRLWHNLRASCESDLAAAFPLATVTKWLGNTPSIALRHYIDPTDASFAQAAGWMPGGAPAAHFAAHPGANGKGRERTSPDPEGKPVSGVAEILAACPLGGVHVRSGVDVCGAHTCSVEMGRLDPPGIEPGSPPCHSGVIPLDHRPFVEVRNAECGTRNEIRHRLLHQHRVERPGVEPGSSVCKTDA